MDKTILSIPNAVLLGSNKGGAVSSEQMKVDAVFEGEGVKGIGLAGAVAATEEKGYEFENVAGTSAGAIVAALIAAGYKANKLREIIQNLDYNPETNSDPQKNGHATSQD